MTLYIVSSKDDDDYPGVWIRIESTCLTAESKGQLSRSLPDAYALDLNFTETPGLQGEEGPVQGHRSHKP